MDRDDILSKAENENINGDEMAVKTRRLSFRHTELIIMIPLVCFTFIRLLKQESTDDFWSIVFAVEAIPSIISGIKDRRWGLLIFGLAMLAIALFSGFQYITGTGILL